MKRESGESPEQSRCCEPHLYRLSLLHSPATAYIYKRWEGKVNRGKSEDLQDRSHASCFRGKSVKNVHGITNSFMNEEDYKSCPSCMGMDAMGILSAAVIGVCSGSEG